MNKKNCLLCGNFISIYIINRTLHDRLGIRILSSRAESISHSFAAFTRDRYFQHSKIKFVSPRGHVISSIYYINTSEIPVELSRVNMISSQVKITCYFTREISMLFLQVLRWLEIVSSIYILMGRFNHSLSLGATSWYQKTAQPLVNTLLSFL